VLPEGPLHEGGGAGGAKRLLAGAPIATRARFPRRRGRAPSANYYPILDRAPKGRDEGGSSEFWIRRHDEYGPDEER
jgi:predicted dithiol-disulfide oxidoreductase (DUF899 family)